VLVRTSSVAAECSQRSPRKNTLAQNQVETGVLLGEAFAPEEERLLGYG
jgi:hypothetical protein